MEQANKIALVTGGARGIGRGISEYLAARGFTVAAVGTRPQSDAAEFLSALRAASPDSCYISGDISKADDRIRIVNEVLDRYGALDVLVNNAGVAPTVRADLLEMSEESLDRLLSINLKGTFFLTQYAARRMLEKKTDEFRAIITITSISADTSSINRGEYCMSKAALSMMTKLFADELAPHGIRVYEVRPGIIATDMTAGVLDKYSRMIENGLLPIKKMGAPEDVAKVVYALASGLHAYTTGDSYSADGGFYLKRL